MTNEHVTILSTKDAGDGVTFDILRCLSCNWEGRLTSATAEDYFPILLTQRERWAAQFQEIPCQTS